MKKNNNSIEIRVRGMSLDEIPKKLHVTKSTLIEWSENFEIEIDGKPIELNNFKNQFIIYEKIKLIKKN